LEVEKIKPNPYQPRREFDEARLRDLSDSIRQYGILQPLVVTRKEYTKEDGGLSVEYELISGEDVCVLLNLLVCHKSQF
jgi:ParB family chromosome partitioning protein